MRAIITLCIAGTLFATLPAQAKLYKWVDENGQVHYGDAIPPQYQKKEHKVLSNKGVTVKDKDAMPTPAELAQRRLQKAEQKKKEKLAKEQRQRDRVLLDTYTTERDLTAARDARIEAVDSQIQLSDSILNDAKTKLEATEKRITQIKAQNKTVPQDLYTKMEREQRSLQTHQRVKAGHIEKRAQISEQFDGYINRFRELKAEQQRKRDELAAKRKAAEQGY